MKRFFFELSGEMKAESREEVLENIKLSLGSGLNYFITEVEEEK